MSRKDAWLPEHKEALFAVFDNTGPKKLNELMKPNAKVSEFLETACQQVFGDTDPKLVTRVRSRVSRIKREFLDYLILLRDKERDPSVADEEYSKKLAFLYDRLPRGLIGLEVTFDLKEAEDDDAAAKKKKPSPPPGTKPKALFRIPVDKEAIGFNRTPPPAEELVAVTQKYKLPGYGSGATVEKVGQAVVPEAAAPDKSILIAEEDILSSTGTRNQISAKEAREREKVELVRFVQEQRMRTQLRRAEARSLFEAGEEGNEEEKKKEDSGDHVELVDGHVDDLEQELEEDLEEIEDVAFKPFKPVDPKAKSLGEKVSEKETVRESEKDAPSKIKETEEPDLKTKEPKEALPRTTEETVPKTGSKTKEVVSKRSEKTSGSVKPSETVSKSSESAKSTDSSKISDKTSEAQPPRKRGRPKGSFKVKDSAARQSENALRMKANESVRAKKESMRHSDSGHLSEEDMDIVRLFDVGDVPMLPTSTPKAPRRGTPSFDHSSPTKRNSMSSQRLSVYDDSDDDMFDTMSDLEKTRMMILMQKREAINTAARAGSEGARSTADLSALMPKRKRGRPRKDELKEVPKEGAGDKSPQGSAGDKPPPMKRASVSKTGDLKPDSTSSIAHNTITHTNNSSVTTPAATAESSMATNNLPQYFEGMQQFLSSVERLYMLADGDTTMRKALAQLVVATTEKIEREKEE